MLQKLVNWLLVKLYYGNIIVVLIFKYIQNTQKRTKNIFTKMFLLYTTNVFLTICCVFLKIHLKNINIYFKSF